MAGMALAFGVILLCAFRITDYDVWWHLKTGEIILREGIPSLDPFAYTREGLPYLATHEWLAQVFFALLYHIGGTGALIAFRTAVALGIAFLLLSLAWRSAWIAAPLILLISALIRGGYVDRPQLFTFLILVIFLRASVFLLQSPPKRTERAVLCFLIFLELLWVNLHGGAALLGIGVLGFLWLERFRVCLHSGSARRAWGEHMFLLLCVLVSALALLASPSGIGNIMYLWNLFNDQTVTFIEEWQPRGIVPYLRDLWWVWGLALFAMALGRRYPVFAGGLLLAFGILSRTAFRHEMLFVLVATAVTLMECNASSVGWRLHEWARRYPLFVFVASALLFAGAFGIERRAAAMFLEKYTSWGYGTVEPAEGAWAFLERKGLTGRMFNTYDLGGYLIFRGYPGRKVFVDGRNIDYGYAFLKSTFEAANDRTTWDMLQQEYGFTLALIHFAPTLGAAPLPYAGLLDRHPQWKLVYFDDSVALYAKDVPEHAALAAYAFLTPANVAEAGILDDIAQAELPELEQELLRAIAEQPSSIRARLVLARLYMHSGRYQAGETLLRDAILAQSHQEKPYELLGVLFMRTGAWADAATMLEAARERTNAAMGEINPSVLSEVHERAGHLWRARWYRLWIGESIEGE